MGELLQMIEIPQLRGGETTSTEGYTRAGPGFDSKKADISRDYASQTDLLAENVRSAVLVKPFFS